MPWSRNARSRAAHRSAKSAGDSVCSASCERERVTARVLGRREQLVERRDRRVARQEVSHAGDRRDAIVSGR